MSLNIPLGAGYSLRSDSRQYIIAKYDGKRDNYLGYFVDIDTALNWLVQRRIREFDSTSIHSYLNQ